MNTTELLQTLAKGLETVLADVAPGAQFSLLVWQNNPDGSGANVNYVSNAQRDTVKRALREVLDRWETPHYKRQ